MQTDSTIPTLSVDHADFDPEGTPKPRALVPAIHVLPSPPLTREASLASVDGPNAGEVARESTDVPTQARPRPPRTSEEGAPTAAEVDLGEQHFLRTSQPFLDMNSYQGSSIHSTEVNDMTNATLADDIIDISGATDVETGYGAGSSKAGPSRQRIDDHPLVHTSPRRLSTPIWELELPPANNNVGTFTSADTHAYQTLRSKPSRPLVPKSSYYFGPPPADAAYGSNPVGKLGTHHPREVIRLERDYTGGELIQFSSAFPLELEGRITPTQFLESVNSINEILIAAHSLRHAALDNAIEIFSLQLSRFFWVSYYERQMRRLRRTIDTLNTDLFNPAGLNILWPRQVAFLFMEIEYY